LIFLLPLCLKDYHSLRYTLLLMNCIIRSSNVVRPTKYEGQTRRIWIIMDITIALKSCWSLSLHWQSRLELSLRTSGWREQAHDGRTSGRFKGSDRFWPGILAGSHCASFYSEREREKAREEQGVSLATSASVCVKVSCTYRWRGRGRGRRRKEARPGETRWDEPRRRDLGAGGRRERVILRVCRFGTILFGCCAARTRACQRGVYRWDPTNCLEESPGRCFSSPRGFRCSALRTFERQSDQVWDRTEFCVFVFSKEVRAFSSIFTNLFLQLSHGI